MFADYNQAQYDSRNLQRCLLASFVVHGVILGVFFVRPDSFFRAPEVAAPLQVDVSFIPPPVVKAKSVEEHRVPRQIVSPTSQESTAESAAERLSDRNAATEREQIRRGAEDAGPVVAPATQAEVAPPSPRQAQRVARESPTKPEKVTEQKAVSVEENSAKAPRALTHLRLDESTLQDRFSMPAHETVDERAQAAIAGALGSAALPSRAAPFSRPRGSGARFYGLRGTSDYLPNLPDGDITLLNTKADLYAVFVRRVALQVFSDLRAAGWDLLSARDIQSLRSESTVRATMSLTGKLLDVQLDGSSGNSRFDEVVATAVKSGTRDPNPPKAAALRDGNIHFVFKAKSWAEFGADPRTGAPGERRWLMLATGLD